MIYNSKRIWATACDIKDFHFFSKIIKSTTTKEAEQSTRELESCKSVVNTDALISPIKRKKSDQCKQCDYESCRVSDLRRHLKIHSGEKSNK